jgi:hypothetical protein
MASIRNMKFIAKGYLLVFVITAICVLAQPALSYCFGYYGSPASPLFFFVILRLCRLALFAALVVALITAVIQKQKCLLAAGAMIAFIAINLLANMLFGPSAIILRGMQNRIGQDHNFDELRRFAREFDKLPQLSNSNFASPSKTYTYQDLIKAGVVGKYPFLSCLGTPITIEKSNVVCILSGRPLKGVYVTVDGTEINSADYSNAETFRASDDIVFAVRMD